MVFDYKSLWIFEYIYLILRQEIEVCNYVFKWYILKIYYVIIIYNNVYIRIYIIIEKLICIKKFMWYFKIFKLIFINYFVLYLLGIRVINQ